MILKKLESADVVMTWDDRSLAGAAAAKADKKDSAGLNSVKSTLKSWTAKNDDYLNRIGKEKEKVKAAKEEVKEMEAIILLINSKNLGGVTQKDIEANVWKLKSLRETLARIDAEAKQIQIEHDKWYLAGPRNGINPVLAEQKVDPKNVDAADASEFNKALHDISAKANEVKGLYEMGVRGSAAALISRLHNLEAELTKSTQAAVVDIRQNVAAEVTKIKTLVDKGLNETKLSKTLTLMQDLQTPGSSKFQNLKAHPEYVAAEKESNKTRLANIPKYLEMVSKQVTRITKSVPVAFQSDAEIGKLVAEMKALDVKNKADLAHAKQTIEGCDQALDKFLKANAASV